MTRPAPMSHAESWAKRPTGPEPKTTTVSPFWISPISAAWYPVGRMSLRNRTSSSSMSSGIFVGPTSANGTRTYSACPPSKPPVVCE